MNCTSSKHDFTVNFDTDKHVTCPVCSSVDRQNGASEKVAGMVPVDALGQFCGGVVQVGLAFCALAQYGVQIGIPPKAQSSAGAQGAQRQLEAGLAMIQAVMQGSAGRIVRPV